MERCLDNSRQVIMEQYIPKSALVAEIERRKESNAKERYFGRLVEDNYFLDFLDTIEVKEVDLYNNGWIDCCERMPVETKQESNTLQGHREWTESEPVLAWDSSYGARIDSTRNGKWRSEQIGGCTGQMIHGIIAWRPIPEFSEELLLKAQIKAQKGEEV